MGNPQRRAELFTREGYSAPLNPTKTWLGSFLAAACKKLSAEADAEDRDAILKNALVQDIDETAAAKPFHAVIEMPDAGQDQSLGRSDFRWIAGDTALRPQRPQHVGDRPYISGVVVDNRNHGSPSM